uniref:DUF389 domain-containing protein n=1 Tax=Mucochytrium quahogii TaxID=96639 RepID=A0A7S2RYL2_9STRA|mmetsp:Transcript_15323/g.24949  ORF Transcript_15323/g.24949 Transcript_15323/m.24949 type:complete len:618 (+) Transcript_15323:2507-4360(+)|eukprot:CAMPEP_0203756832 /NCGR_PEP_ID=MMETSP0098-20131031/10029_1 /ASSEMBLY_ACC=CAM_ASM_000208 /TAXON_ID=96639 /ORGANISM=" , Strain NY0313808BC1" /LENGTH=617 /DNA_ID=CAMNT_0050648855 /DNA_START=528 /DNA_END=2384 /DNA_ORIENTATION=-
MSTVLVKINVPAVTKKRGVNVEGITTELTEDDDSGIVVETRKGVTSLMEIFEQDEAPKLTSNDTKSAEKALSACMKSSSKESLLIDTGKRVREFIGNSKVDFISEIAYVYIGTKWIEFTFSCKLTFAEECLKRLGNLGIGAKGGIGVVNIIPLHLQRMATRLPVEKIKDDEKPGSPSRELSSHIQVRIDESPPIERSLSTSEIELDKLKSSAVNVLIDHPEDAEGKQNLMPYFSHEEGDEIEAEDNDSDIQSQPSGMKSTFMDTIKSRIAVDSVVELVNSSAQFSFDYVMLVIVASILACIGLVTNNVVVIVASMLVSPLMGPILAVTFGLTMLDTRLIKKGLFSELVGLLICCAVGYVGGLCAAPVNGDTWPTSEMWSRASGMSVVVGICIAIPSGVGVALSVLGNNTSSLVGVAISASLLPPAVNTGVLLAMATLHATEYINFNKTTVTGIDPGDLTVRSIVAGACWSLLLTIANIICIWIAGVLMFKIKEVTPLDGKSDFWKTHIPNTRAYNTVVKHNAKEAEQMKDAVRRALNMEDEVQNNGKMKTILNANNDGVYATLQAMQLEPPAHRRARIHDPSFFIPPEEEQLAENVQTKRGRGVTITNRHRGPSFVP